MSLYDRVFLTEVRDLPPPFPHRPGREKSAETYSRQGSLYIGRESILAREARKATADRAAAQAKRKREREAEKPKGGRRYQKPSPPEAEGRFEKPLRGHGLD